MLETKKIDITKEDITPVITAKPPIVGTSFSFLYTSCTIKLFSVSFLMNLGTSKYVTKKLIPNIMNKVFSIIFPFSLSTLSLSLFLLNLYGLDYHEYKLANYQTQSLMVT